MDNPLAEQYRRMFNVELPPNDTMDDYLDAILSKIRPMSEDLREEEFWLNKRWKEIRDDLTFHEAVLHIFREDGQYLISVDGNISIGEWGNLEHPNTLVLRHGKRHELYDMAFLNDNFLILKKHGDQRRKGHTKYFVMGNESTIRNLEWRDCMELMFNIYRNNSRWTSYLTFALILIALIVILSIV